MNLKPTTTIDCSFSAVLGISKRAEDVESALEEFFLHKRKQKSSKSLTSDGLGYELIK